MVPALGIGSKSQLDSIKPNGNAGTGLKLNKKVGGLGLKLTPDMMKGGDGDKKAQDKSVEVKEANQGMVSEDSGFLTKIQNAMQSEQKKLQDLLQGQSTQKKINIPKKTKSNKVL